MCRASGVGQDVGVSAPGPEDGNVGNDRRADPGARAAQPRYDEYGEPEDQPTTVLRRPSVPSPAPPRTQPPVPPGAAPADSAWQATVSVPRPANYPPAGRDPGYRATGPNRYGPPADATARYGPPSDTPDRYGPPAGARSGYGPSADGPPADAPAGYTRHQPPPRGSHLPPYSEPLGAGAAEPDVKGQPGTRSPRKLTVTRVAALRSRELTNRGVQMFHRATTADGADKSGLEHLTYAVMANYAVDAALAVALAGTLFFAAAAAESTGRVLLYLVITVAPFAVIAPFIGPMLDRLQSGRRLALAMSSFGRALLALLMAFNFSNFNPWVIYPCALGNLVLSKAFGVLKAALTPRVLPEQITLVKTNSRLTTFGMIAGGAAGALAAGLSKAFGSPGALFFTAACAVGGGILCLRIPAWVESTEGEVPVKQVATGTARGFPPVVVATLWANSMIRVETGFLALFIAFVVKSQYPQPQYSAFTQLLLLGVIGAAAGVGGFAGNAMGARLPLSAPETISLLSLVAVFVATVVAVVAPGLATAAIFGFVGSTASSLAKVSLDSVIQRDLPEESRASGFGKSESILQLAWVFGGVLGLLLGGVWTFGHANVYVIGFSVVGILLVAGLVQSWLIRTGRSMLPAVRTRRSGRRNARTRKSGHRRCRERCRTRHRPSHPAGFADRCL